MDDETRVRKCAETLEDAHLELIDRSIRKGWTEREVCLGLFWLAAFHLQLMNGDASRLEDVAALVRRVTTML
ncbi:MAG: hypothetical protein ACTHJ3_07765 [Pararhizobium sp.]